MSDKGTTLYAARLLAELLDLESVGPLDGDERTRLDALRDLSDAVGGLDDQVFCDWAALRHVAMDRAEGATGLTVADWPLFHVDWEAATRDFSSDLTAVDFDGDSYWIVGE